MRERRPARLRRAYAVTAALLWLLGVEVLPNVHLATHDHDHTHAADGSIVHVRGASHDHAHDHADAHEHAHAAIDSALPSGVRAKAGLAIEHDDDDFARLGIAHEHLSLDAEFAYVTDELAHGHHHAVGHDHSDDITFVFDHLSHDGELTLDHDTPAGHTATGIAHHALALHEAPPPPAVPVVVPHAETWRHAAPNERISAAELSRPTARGPPVA